MNTFAKLSTLFAAALLITSCSKDIPAEDVIVAEDTTTAEEDVITTEDFKQTFLTKLQEIETEEREERELEELLQKQCANLNTNILPLLEAADIKKLTFEVRDTSLGLACQVRNTTANHSVTLTRDYTVQQNNTQQSILRRITARVIEELTPEERTNFLITLKNSITTDNETTLAQDAMLEAAPQEPNPI